MTKIEDRPTIEERYSRALESTHLEVIADERCSVDMLIAMGWVNDGLGAALYRLRDEFDSIRGERDLAQRDLNDMMRQHAQALAAEAAELSRPAFDPDVVRYFSASAKRISRQISTSALTARALMMTRLKTLEATKQALGKFAVILATRERFMRDDRHVLQIAGRALDGWLDPMCPPCNGTGAVGGYGSPRVICTACHGSTKRVIRLGPDADSCRFGKALLARMDAKSDYVTGQMRRYLASR